MSSISTSCVIRRRGSSRIIRADCWISRSTLHPATRPDEQKGASAYPVTVRLERLDPSHEGQVETVKARFVVGCDGARSAVRKSLGLALAGDSANQAWGVMDVLAVTDFPDIRIKSAIQSANEGSAPDHSARRRLSRPPLYRTRQTQRERAGLKPERHARTSDRRGAADPPSLHAGSEGDRLVVGLRDRPAALRQVRRRAGRRKTELPARVHRRRRLPYAQPQSRARHERLDAGRLQSGVETGVGPAGTMLAQDPAIPIRPNARPSPRS